MSCSAEGAPSWAEFRERAALAVELHSPAAELAAVLQRYREDLDAAANAGVESREQGLRALADQAALVVELEAMIGRYEPQLVQASLEAVHRALRILKDRMLDQIAAAGLEVVRLAGASAADVIDLVEVQCWRHGDEFATEVVAEELEAAVRLDGVVLHSGRVVMGAPRDPEPLPDRSDEPGAPDEPNETDERGHPMGAPK